MIIYGQTYRIDYILTTGFALVRRSMSEATNNVNGSILLGGYQSQLVQVPLDQLFDKKEKREFEKAEYYFNKFGSACTKLKEIYGTTDLKAIKAKIAGRLVGHTRQFLPVGIDPNGQIKMQTKTAYSHDNATCVQLVRREYKEA